MTNMTEMTIASLQMLLAQQIKEQTNYIAEMRKQVAALAQRVRHVTREETFTNVLEREIEEMAAEIGCTEAIWVNPVTGNKATSIYLAFLALDFWHSRFHVVRNAAKLLHSHHERHNLKTVQRSWSRGWPTPCIDLSDVEALVLSTAPVKGHVAIRSFKTAHRING